MSLSKDQALSIADDLIADAKRRAAQQKESAEQIPVWYRVGIPEMTAFSRRDQITLVARAKKRTWRSLTFKVVLFAVVISNTGLAMAWLSGWVKPEAGGLWLTAAGWLHLVLFRVLMVVMTRYNIQKMAIATLNAGYLKKSARQ